MICPLSVIRKIVECKRPAACNSFLITGAIPSENRGAAGGVQDIRYEEVVEIVVRNRYALMLAMIPPSL